MPGSVPPTPDKSITSAAILLEATRCWRQARDMGLPLQPRLAQALDRYGDAMLAPVIDSLIRFFEAALGRSLKVGVANMLSEDERLLLGLLDGSCRRACLDCVQATGRPLDCAVRSTRIMLALTLGQPVKTYQSTMRWRGSKRSRLPPLSLFGNPTPKVDALGKYPYVGAYRICLPKGLSRTPYQPMRGLVGV